MAPSTVAMPFPLVIATFRPLILPTTLRAAEAPLWLAPGPRPTPPAAPKLEAMWAVPTPPAAAELVEATAATPAVKTRCCTSVVMPRVKSCMKPTPQKARPRSAPPISPTSSAPPPLTGKATQPRDPPPKWLLRGRSRSRQRVPVPMAPMATAARHQGPRNEAWDEGEWKAAADDRRRRLTTKETDADELPDERYEATGAGHPECTSGADDCIGSTESRLVRDLCKGKAGDLYCEPCWDSCYEQNSNLQGELLDEVV